VGAETALGVLGAATGVGGAYYGWRALDQDAVERSRAAFRKERDELRERFVELCGTAAAMHLAARPGLERILGTSLLWEPAMRPPAPVPLSSVTASWLPAAPPADGALLRAARRGLPKESKWQRYPSYSTALGALARPALFENRPSFRLVAADWQAQTGPRLTFTRARYFDLVDQNEAVAHELARATRSAPHRTPAWRRVPLRKLMADDPLSFTRRTVLPSVGTLTIRRTADGNGTFFLLLRGKGRVATGEETYGPLPAGMFQPASLSPLAHREDLDLWRTLMREYNEELLGAPDAIGDAGSQVDYTEPPYGRLDAALADGSLRVWCLGMGLEPLNLAVCILTVAVFEADTFDEIFAGAVEHNDEGKILGGPRSHGTVTGLPLTAESVSELPADQMSSPAAGLLQLALHHRAMLLA
jgi:hypothetical protein